MSEQQVSALPLLDQLGQEHLHTVDGTPQVDVDGRPPVVVGHRGDRPGHGDTGVVEHQVHGTEQPERLVCQVADVLEPTDVTNHAVGLQAVRPQSVDGLVQGGLVNIGEDDPCAARRELPRGGQADSTGAAGDDRPAALETVHGRRTYPGSGC